MRRRSKAMQTEPNAVTVHPRASQRGSAMMELAVVLPLLLVTTVGLVDFGRAAFEAIEVENAAHAGASSRLRNGKRSVS